MSELNINKIVNDFIDDYLPNAGLRVSLTFDKEGTRIVHNVGGQFFIRNNTTLSRSEIENQICVFLLKTLEDEGIVLYKLKTKLEGILEGLKANGQKTNGALYD